VEQPDGFGINMKIIIPGKPIAKARPKFFITPMSDLSIMDLILDWENKGSNPNITNLVRMALKKAGRYIRAYVPQKSEEKDFIDKLMPQLNGHKILEGPVEVVLWFGMPRPKSHYGTGRNSGKLKKSAPEHPGIKPDIDNFIKFVFDLFNDRVWEDDKLVVRTMCEKAYAEEPRTEILIRGI
jgi:Holliday junction resolvase RusA-like endonuclease